MHQFKRDDRAIRILRVHLLWFALLAQFACAPALMRSAPGEPCATPTFSVDDAFAGARRGACTAYANATVRLRITPENDGYINDSAWFAFRMTPRQQGNAYIQLRYSGGHHRYVPKISTDGVNWTALPRTSVANDKRFRRARFAVPLGDQPVFVAAHELVLPDGDATWLQGIAQRSEATTRVVGTSIGGRPITLLESGHDKSELVMFVGRQHPPEVSGSFGMKGFIEMLYADTPRANAFRSRFAILTVPMINPDGVVAGHWRHNLGGKDLNRDWGPFSQPETRLMRDLIDEFDAAGRKIRLFLDFHSTRKNVFYTQQDDDPIDPPAFTERWLDASRSRLNNYPFEHLRRHNTDQPTSKNYMYTRFGVPSITYEVGDETNREHAAAAAAVFADEMMRLLLETPN